MYVFMYACMYVCLSVCLTVCLSVCVSVCLFVCLSVCMPKIQSRESRLVISSHGLDRNGSGTSSRSGSLCCSCCPRTYGICFGSLIRLATWLCFLELLGLEPSVCQGFSYAERNQSILSETLSLTHDDLAAIPMWPCLSMFDALVLSSDWQTEESQREAVSRRLQ